MVEYIVERITKIAIGASLDNVDEFEELSVTVVDEPTSVLPINQY